MWRIATITGLLAGAVGLLGWIFALFGPTGQYESVEASSDGSSTVIDSGTTSMWGNEEFNPILVIFLLIMLTSVLGVIAGAILHERRNSDAGLPILWVSAFALLLGSILSMFSIGLFLLPGALLSILAALLASVAPGPGIASDRAR